VRCDSEVRQWGRCKGKVDATVRCEGDTNHMVAMATQWDCDSNICDSEIKDQKR
jgi:hypothetical protein